MDDMLIVLLGAGRQALETSEYCAELGHRVVAFIEEHPPAYDRELTDYGAPILTFADDLGRFAGHPAVVAVGDPKVKRRMVSQWPFPAFASPVAPTAWLAHDVVVGTGTTIGPAVTVNRKAVIGKHVLINAGSNVSHDSNIGDFATLCPAATLGGAVEIGVGSFIGIGATLIDHIRVGSYAYVAAGAVVIRDVEEQEVVQGVPARHARYLGPPP